MIITNPGADLGGGVLMGKQTAPGLGRVDRYGWVYRHGVEDVGLGGGVKRGEITS